MSSGSESGSGVIITPNEEQKKGVVVPKTDIPTMSRQLKVAAMQQEPVWNDLQGGVDKVCQLVQEAAANGANVLGFPEVFIPGYPWTIWTDSKLANIPFTQEYMANSLRRDSPEMDRIRAAVQEAGIFIVLGYSERSGNSLYIAQSFIDPTGTIVLHRRKIMPTSVERSVWGNGQAESLTCVAESPFAGARIGGLNCWEHLQPLLRYYEYSQGVDVHVAGWPPVWDKPKELPQYPYHLSAEACYRASQFMAMEGAHFVLCSTQFLTEGNAERIKVKGVPFIKPPGGGFAMIFGPDGSPLCADLDPTSEGIQYADIDLDTRNYATQALDVVGHYSRPDLLSLLVNRKAASAVSEM